MNSFASDVFLLNDLGCKKLRIFPLSFLRGTEVAYSFGTNEEGIKFSSIFPREVIETNWMDRNEVFYLKGIQKKMEDSANSLSVAVESLKSFEMENKDHA